jgi:hypothetical protein
MKKCGDADLYCDINDQTCQDGKSCFGGICAYGYTCTNDARCVMVTDPNQPHAYKTEEECLNDVRHKICRS